MCQYILKQTDFDTLSDQFIQNVQDQINRGPGKGSIQTPTTTSLNDYHHGPAVAYMRWIQASIFDPIGRWCDIFMNRWKRWKFGILGQSE